MDTLTDNQSSLPVGCTALDMQANGPFEIVQDLDLAFDLARLGASEKLVRQVGGEEAVRLAKADGSANVQSWKS